jgi:hypothetical protein
MLLVQNNPDLGGKIDASFLANCDRCDVSGCRWNGEKVNPMLSPFLSGSSLSSADISLIFGAGPKEAVEVSRAQGEVTDLAEGNPDYEEHTKHLSPELLATNTSWCLWQKVYLDELRANVKGRLYVFCTEGFKEKFLSKKYTEGGDGRDGKFLTAKEVCKAQDFNPAYGFDAEWGFPPGISAKSILDWVSRSKRSNYLPNSMHSLKYVFLRSALGTRPPGATALRERCEEEAAAGRLHREARFLDGCR